MMAAEDARGAPGPAGAAGDDDVDYSYDEFMFPTIPEPPPTLRLRDPYL